MGLSFKFPIVGLSPMDGITDEAFRLTQCHISQPDLIFTEFVSAEGLSHNAVKLFDQLLFSPLERPIIGQLFGKDPDSFYTATIILCHLGFDGIDINMGCPAKTVTHHGSGGALIDNPALAGEIILAVQSAVADFSSRKTKLTDLKLKEKTLQIISRNLKYSDHRSLITDHHHPTISVKTRLGTSSSVVDTWIPFLLRHQLDFITLHGRTLKQGYSGLADWSQIQQAVHLATGSATPILGNGDIHNRQQGIDYCHQYGTAGVLIGRAALGNPWLFANQIPTPNQRFEACLYHYQQFLEVFPHRRTDGLRRHLLAYTSGLPHARQLRAKLISVSTIDQLLTLEKEFTDC